MNTQKRIEQYFEDRLSLKEKEEFEKELRINPVLAGEVEKRRKILGSISGSLAYVSMFDDDHDLKHFTRQQEISMEEDIIEFHREYETKESGKTEKLKKTIKKIIGNTGNIVSEPMTVFRIAASLLIFFLISGTLLYFLYYTNKENRKQMAVLAIGYFPPEKDSFLGDLKNTSTILRHVPDNNEPMEYPLQSLNESDNDKLLLFAAVSDLENNDLLNARKKLEALMFTEHHKIKSSATWYYSLLCAREGNYREATRVLKNISGENTYYKPKADSLLFFLRLE